MAKIIISIITLNLNPESYIDTLDGCSNTELDSSLKQILRWMLIGHCDLIYALELLKQYDIGRYTVNHVDEPKTNEVETNPIEKLFITDCDFIDRFIIFIIFHKRDPIDIIVSKTKTCEF